MNPDNQDKENNKNASSKRIKLLNEIFQKQFDSKQELLDFALEQALILTNSKFGYIYYYSEETQLFELNTWSKEVMPDCQVVNPQTCYELDKTGFWGEAVRQRKPLILNDFQHPHKLKKGYPDGHVSIKKFLTTPIFDDNKIIAVAGIANKVEDYDDDDVKQLQLLINSVWEISKNIELSNKYAQIFKATEQAETSIVITNIDGNIEHVNPFFTQITGYTREESLGKNPRILKSGHQSKEFYKQLWSLISNGKTWRGELKNKRKNGEYYWEEAVISPLSNEKGKITHYIAVKNDITKQKKALEKLEKSEIFKDSVISVLAEGLVVQNQEYEIVLANQAAADILGLTLNQLIGKDSYDPLWQALDENNEPLPPEQHPSLVTLKTGKKVRDFIMKVHTGKDDQRTIKVNSNPVFNKSGKVEQAVTTFSDITNIEKTKKELFQATRQLESIFQNANVAIGVSDLKGNFTQFNEAFLKIFELQENEVLNTNIGALTHPDFLPKETKLLNELLKGEIESYRVEKKILTPKGEKWINLSGTTVKNQKGEITNLIGAAIDISENKKNEFELKNSQILLEKSQEIAKLGSWEYDFKTDTVKWSKALYEIYEYPHELPAPKYESEQKSFYGENTYNDLDKALKECITSGKPYNLEFKIITFKGNEKHIITIGQAKKDSNNNVVSIVGTAQDITERKKLDLELVKAKEIAEKSQSQLKYAIDGTQAATWDWNIKTGEVEFNERWAEIIGYSLTELQPISIETWQKFAHTEDFEKSNELLKKHFKKEIKYYDFKSRMKHKSGKWVWVWDRGKVVEWDNSQKPIRMVGTHMDITDWVEAEQKVIENEQQFRHIYNSTQMGIGYYDTKGNVINYNHIALKNINKKADEIEGKNITEIFPGPSGIEYLKRINKTLKDNKNWTQKDCIDQENNIWYESHYSTVINNNNEILGVLIISINISEKIKAEKTIIESEEKYRFLTNELDQILWTANPAGELNFINSFGEKYFGNYASAILQKGWASVVHPDDAEQATKVYLEFLKSKTSYTSEFRVLTKNNTYQYIRTFATPRLNNNGEIEQIIGYAIDIQNEKSAELKNKEHQKELAFIAKYGKLFLNAKSPEEVFEYISDGIFEVLDRSTIVTSAIYLNKGHEWRNIKFQGPSKWLENFPKIFNFSKLTGKTHPLLLHNTKANNVINLGGDIYSLTMGIVPNPIAKIATNFLPEFNVKAINIFKNKEVFGNISYLEFKDTKKLNYDLIFTFLNEASTSIEKIVVSQELAESNQRFQLASAATKDVVWDWDLKTDKLIWGNSVYNVFGNLALKGHIDDWRNNIHKYDYERVSKELKQYLDNKNCYNYKIEYKFKKADNTFADVIESGTILRAKNGKPFRLIGALKDNTETKKFTEAIQKQNKRLKTISWIQSHELRAPLSRILGIAELMKERDLDNELFEELLENIIKSSQELDVVVKSIVDEADLK